MHNAKVRLQLWSSQLRVVIPELAWVKLTFVDHGLGAQGSHVKPEIWLKLKQPWETNFEPGSVLWDSVCCNLSQSESSPAHLFTRKLTKQKFLFWVFTSSSSHSSVGATKTCVMTGSEFLATLPRQVLSVITCLQQRTARPTDWAISSNWALEASPCSISRNINPVAYLPFSGRRMSCSSLEMD